MDEKEIIHEAEVEIEIETEEDADYEDLLKKFEEPQVEEKIKKRRSPVLGASLLTLVLIAGMVLFLFFTPQQNAEDTEDTEAAITCATDSNKVWQGKIKTTDNGKVEKNGTGELVEYLPEKIKNIAVENETGSFSIDSVTPKKTSAETDTEETSKTQYTLVDYEDFSLEDGKPDDLANDCATVSFTGIISPDAKDNLKDYGLDKPRAIVTVTYTDKTKAIIKVGNDALQGAGTYISFGTSDAVYIVATESVDSLLWGVKDFISLTVNKTADESENANFNYVQLTGKAYGEKITLEYNKDTNSVASTYLMTSPKEIFADDVNASTVSGGIRGILAAEVVCVKPTAKDIKKYGLADDYAHLVAEYPDTTVNLFASQPDKEGYCYLMENGGQVIYHIPSSSIGWVNTTAKELESEYVLNAKLTGLTKMTVNTGKKYEFVTTTKTTPTTDDDGNTTESTSTTVHYGTKAINLSYFETYFGNIGLLTTANTDSTSPSGKADLTVTYEYSSSRDNDTVSFYKASDGKHIVKLNSQVVGQVYSTYIEKIAEQTDDISKNKSVKSFW